MIREGMEKQHSILSRNYTVFISEEEEAGGFIRDRAYEQFMADVWVGVVLTLMVLSCICCMCSFLIYHKFQTWKINAVDGQPRPYTIDSVCQEGVGSATLDVEMLPNYTLVSGLPSYDEALAQLRSVHELNIKTCHMKVAEVDINIDEQKQQNSQPSRLSLADFLQIYKSQRIVP